MNENELDRLLILYLEKKNTSEEILCADNHLKLDRTISLVFLVWAKVLLKFLLSYVW